MDSDTPIDLQRATKMAHSLGLYHYDYPALRAFRRAIITACGFGLAFTGLGFLFASQPPLLNIFTGVAVVIVTLGIIFIGGGSDGDDDIWIDFEMMRDERYLRRVSRQQALTPLNNDQCDFVVAYAAVTKHLKGKERRELHNSAVAQFEELGAPKGNDNEHAR